jgi:pSer/pThr/pTyr-binding forkhead associated (FHA) protein/tetratricopeptide (TPR) repeat protein
MYKLVIEDDEGKSTVVPIVRDEITIGRKEGNTIRLTERNVSRSHARIVKDGDEVRVENVASRYGIKHNGEKISAPTPFKEGDVVMIGDYRLRLKNEAKEKKAPIKVPSSKSEKTGILDLTDGPDLDDAPSGKVGRLVVVSSNYAGREYPLIKTEMVIGRTDGDIRIDHRSISRNHAKIVRDGERYKILDLRSSNGVRVNGEEYRSVHLKKGDEIELGHVKFRYVAPGERFHYRPEGMAPVAPASGGMGKIVVGMIGVSIALVLVLLIGFVIVQQMGGEGEVAGGSAEETEVDAGEVEKGGSAEATESNEEVKAYLRKAEKAMAKEAWEKALVYLEDALEIEPNNEEANAKRSQATLEKGMKRTYVDGKAALDRGDHTTAMEKFLEIPENLSIYYRKIKDEGLLQKAIDANIADKLDDARMLFQNRDFKGALASVDQVLKMEKSNTEARKLRKAIVAERNKMTANDTKRGDKPKKVEDTGQAPNKAEPRTTPTKMDKAERRAKGRAAINEARQKSSRGSYAECIQKANEAKKFGVVDNNLFGLCYEKMGNGGMAVKHYNMWLRGNGSNKLADRVRKKIIGLGGTPVN